MEKIQLNKMDIGIVGGGPGGVTAAIYAKRMGYDVELFEKMAIGGKVTTTSDVSNYPGFSQIDGMNLSDNFLQHLKSLEIKINYTTVESLVEVKDFEKISEDDKEKIQNILTKKDESFKFKNLKDLVEGYNYAILTNKDIFLCKFLIIAIGTTPRYLGVEGEKEYFGKGVSYCATCDGPLYRNKNVAIVGGGNTAYESAVVLARTSKNVYIIERSPSRAEKMLQEEALKNENVHLITNTIVTKINGDNFVTSLELQDVNDPSKTSTLDDIQGVFVNIGIQIDKKLFDGLLDLTPQGEIITNANMQTSKEYIFAVGDVRNTPSRQIVTAASDGAIAIEKIRTMK